jgi:hypothetical protein
MVSRASSPTRARTSSRETPNGGQVQEQEQEQNGQRAAHAPAEQTGTGTEERREMHSAMLRLPFLTARFDVPQPSGRPMRLGPVTLPSPGKTAYYAGLGVLAVTEVIEWPVAAAIAAGTYVAQHTRTSRGDQPRGDQPRGDQARGDQPRGDQPRGDQARGDQPRGDQAPAEQAHDGQRESANVSA